MELVVTLRRKESYDAFKDLVDGIIVGKYFTGNYHFTLNELQELSIQAKKDHLKFYIAMDDLISEDEKPLLYDYLDFISKLNVDGIYFHDLAILESAKSFHLFDKLIYDGKTLLTNSLETSFYLSMGIDSVVLSRELTYEEVLQILKNSPRKVDMQIHGHLRLSYSKRHFLKNYFKEINDGSIHEEKEDYTLTEENRDYRMPITDDSQGTKIYSDFIFETYKEIPELRNYLQRGIIDTLFINDHLIQKYLIDYKRINEKNKDYLDEELRSSAIDLYSSGYFYMKTNKTKDGQD